MVRVREHSTNASICALHSRSALAFCCFINVSASRFDRMRCCDVDSDILTLITGRGLRGKIGEQERVGKWLRSVKGNAAWQLQRSAKKGVEAKKAVSRAYAKQAKSRAIG